MKLLVVLMKMMMMMMMMIFRKHCGGFRGYRIKTIYKSADINLSKD